VPPFSGKSVTPPSLKVCRADDGRWLRFLGSQPEATLFHHPAWSQVLVDCYGHQTLVLVQTDAEDEIVAGVPLIEMRRAFGGRRFASLPFTDYCPPVASTPANLALLTRNLVNWRDATGGRVIAVHGALPHAPGLRHANRAVRHVLPLGRTSEQVQQGLNASRMRGIRKAQRLGVHASLSQSAADLPAFYQLHLETRRRLGVPVQPRRFLEALWKSVVLRGLGFVVFAYKDGRPIAAALFLAWNGTLIYKFAASDPRYWELRPNNLVIWTAIDWACQQGYGLLDFGKTDLGNQGLRDFKSRWGSIETPLVNSYIGQSPPGLMPKLPSWALTKVIQSSPPIVCRAIGELLYGRIGTLA
jgi:CelD/BcsL family acetyltransferase involved in cellulose biosynthesis